MGNCCNSEEQVSSFNQSKEPRNESEACFYIAGIVQQQLQGLCYSYDQLYEIASRIISAQTEIINDKGLADKKKLKSLSKEKLGNLNCWEISEKYFPQSKGSSTKSSIFYILGNQLEHNDNQYENVSPQQIGQLAHYETIEDSIQIFAKNFYLKKRQIEEDTQNINNLFRQSFVKYERVLNSLEYHLKDSLLVAQFARHSCIYDKRGIFIFLQFMIQCIRQLESDGKSFDQIEKLVNFVITTLSTLYPPGQGLEQSDQYLQEALKQIEYSDKNSIEIDAPLKFQTGAQKRVQMQKFILEKAAIAEEELFLLQDLIQQNCIKKCIGVASGLKVTSNNPNKKALIRITEKMLLKKKKQALETDQEKQKPEFKHHQNGLEQEFQITISRLLKEKSGSKKSKNLKEILDQEDEAYRKTIEQILKSKTELWFSISDMVRGKCTFSKIEDILETIANIKNFVEKQNRKYPKRFRIMEIESRFTRKIPISDITLKIALNERIVAELQLTLQSNSAAYNFAHKIYQFQRSEAFSKIKTLHNYFEEYQNQFCQLIRRKIEIASTKDSTISKQTIASVNKFFKIDGCSSVLNLNKIVSSMKADISSQKIMFNEEQKVLTKVVFGRKMLKKDEERVPYIKEHTGSKLFNTVLYCQIIKDVDLNERVQQICVPYYWHGSYLQSKFDFNIRTIGYHKTIRSFLKDSQLFRLFDIFKQREIIDVKKFEDFISSVYGRGQYLSEWFIKKGKMQEQAGQYTKAEQSLDKALNIVQNSLNPQNNLILTIKFNKGRLLIKNGSLKEAMRIFENVKDSYMSKKQYKNVVICLMVLSECAVRQGSFEKSEQYTKNATIISKMHKVSQNGFEIANSQYRIGEHLWKTNDPKFQIRALETNFRVAFEELSKFQHATQLIVKMKKYWLEYSKNNVAEPELNTNSNVEILEFKKIYGKQDFDCSLAGEQSSFLRKAKWPNLKILKLFKNSLQAQGCEPLSKANWPKLQYLNIEKNKIQDQGCEYLSKGAWPKLKQLELSNNDFSEKGCKSLKQGQWPELELLNISANTINGKGCEYLIQGSWLKLKSLNLISDTIGNQGCKYLMKSKWPNLEILLLVCNQIDASGCEYLSKAQWPRLKQLDINFNTIKSQGCELLTRANWPELKILILNFNEINEPGCEKISKGKWPKLEELDISNNKLNESECQKLVNGEWPNLQKLNLNDNGIKGENLGQILSAKFKKASIKV